MTAWELLRTADDYGLLDPHGPYYDTPFPPSSPNASHRPRVVVENGADYDFGVMDVKATGSHGFVFKNDGNAPLKLAAGQTTCKCTVSDVPEEPVAPGESVRIKIEWEPQGASQKYHQSAKILTNDPDRPVVRLILRGWITERLRAVPPKITFGGVSSNEERTVQFDLFGYYDDRFEIIDHEWTNPETAGFFSARWEPLSAAEIAEQPHAKAGLRVFVTLKPGLPLGPINQTIRLTTNLAKALPVEVSLGGKIASDVSIFGSAGVFDRERDLLTLGVLSQAEEKTIRLFVLVRGPRRHEVLVDVGQVVPEVLDVSLGDPQPMNQGKVVRYPLVITVPRGSRPVSYLGSNAETLGRIIIETTHPQAPRIPIYVRVAVQ
jgi:hypothetical protein